MGAFFTNIQLRTLNLDKTGLTEKVIECITKVQSEAGFVAVANENEADKTVVILPSDDSTWLSVYDEEMEDQGSGKPDKLASQLSKQFKTAALGIIVNDSDSVYVGLTINGTLQDTISNFREEIDFGKNKPAVWETILINNYVFDDIRKAWLNTSIFVEDFLTGIAKLSGLDPSKLLTGYEYLNEEGPNEGIRLHFAHKEKKKHAEHGLTKFGLVYGGGLVEVKSGEKQDIEWLLTNYGASSTGLDIVIAGECIEQGLLIPEAVIVSYFKQQSDPQNEWTVLFTETVATTGEKVFYARLEEMIIPEGFKPTYPMTPKEAKRYAQISYDCGIKCKISFVGAKEGNGEVTVFFSPLVNRQEGTYCAGLSKESLEDWMKRNAL